MSGLFCKAVVGLVLGGAVVGCANDSGPRYVERALVAAPNGPESRVEYERPKPLPEPAGRYERDVPPAPDRR